MPYPDHSFDGVFAYHVISHTDTDGMGKIIGEIMRILKKDGEFFLTLCSKESGEYTRPDYPKLDENTVLKTDDGPEKDIPHFYTSLDDILTLFKNQTICNIRYIDDCYSNGAQQDCKHYFILGKA